MVITASGSSAPPSKTVPLDLKSLLVPQVRDRIAAAEAAKNQILDFEQAPAPAPAKPSGGTISRREAIPFESVAEVSGAPSATTNSMARSAAVAPPLPKILGTANDDDITGTDQDEAVYGFAGNDKLRGANGSDVLYGGLGNDIISGDHVPAQTTSSDDYLSGEQGDDKLFGRIGYDTLLGGDNNDQLFGGSAGDTLRGGKGDDQLFGGIVAGDLSFNPFPDESDNLGGGAGNDYLDGDAGNDYLLGTDSSARGAGELDILTGGGGSDTFVIGDKKFAYYTQGGASQDFALILDFATGDKVRLQGNASQYVLGYDSTENSTALGYLGSGSFELVAVFSGQNLAPTTLTSSAFQYLA
jgi:Ca2+-binding RTX toxin-like protein